MQMISTKTRSLLLVLGACGPLSLEAAAQNSVLVLPGQTVAGAGTITAVGEFAVNSHGSWVALAQTNLTLGSLEAVLLRDGTPVVVPNGTQIAPTFSTSEAFLDIDDAGNVAWLGIDPGTGERVVMLNQKEILRQGTVVDLNGDGVAAPVSWPRCMLLADDGSGAIYANLTEGSAFDRALVRLRRNSVGALLIDTVVTKGTMLPDGSSVPIYDSITSARYRYELDSNADGDLLFAVEYKGIFKYQQSSGTLSNVILNDEESPLVGQNWNTSFRSGRSLADNGTAYNWARLIGSVPGSFAATSVIAKNKQILLTDGDSFSGPQNLELLIVNSSSPIRFSAGGSLLWLGIVNQGGSENFRALYRNKDLVAAEGITRIEGQRLVKIGGGAMSFDINADGTAILLRGELENGLVGIFRIAPDAKATVLNGCFPKTAKLQPLASSWPIDSDTALTMFGSQDTSAVAFLLLSPSGYDGCGLLLPGIGELLLDLQPDTLLVVPSISPSGPLQAFFLLGINLQYDLAFQGANIYSQGLWYSPLNPVEPVRFSNGLKFTLGI